MVFFDIDEINIQGKEHFFEGRLNEAIIILKKLETKPIRNRLFLNFSELEPLNHQVDTKNFDSVLRNLDSLRLEIKDLSRFI